MPYALQAAVFDGTATGGGFPPTQATLGQPVVGGVSSRSVTLGQGFWHGGIYKIYLPLVIRKNQP